MQTLADTGAGKFRRALPYLFLFFALAPLCYLFPYSHDDWAWGSPQALELLKTGFSGLNGRYLGNVIVLLLTRSAILRALVMAATLTGIVALLGRIVKRRFAFPLSLVALLGMPKMLFSQAVVWTSGFSNYAVSVLFLLACIAQVIGLCAAAPRDNRRRIVPLFLLGAGSCLLVEHVTVYCVLLGAGALLFSRIRYRRVCVQHVAYLLGAVLAAAVMFANSNYAGVLRGESGYQRVALSGGLVEKLGGSFLNYIVPWAFMDNLLLNLLLGAALLLAFRRYFRDAAGWRRPALAASAIIATLYTLYAVLRCLLPASGKLARSLPYVDGVVVILYVAAGAAFLCALPVRTCTRLRLLFFGASAGVLAAPFLLVGPVTARCFFASYVMLFLLALELFNAGVARRPAGARRLVPRACYAATALLAVAILGQLYFVFSANHECEERRAAQIAQSVRDGAQEIDIMRLPYADYVWRSDPTDTAVKYMPEKFRAFYRLDESVRIKSVPYEKPKAASYEENAG